MKYFLFVSFYCAILLGDFQDNLAQPTPPWMQQQIDLILSRFDHQLSKKYLDHLFKTTSGAVRMTLRNRQFSVEICQEAKTHHNAIELQQLFGRLYQEGKLPLDRDIDFIWTCLDYVQCTACHIPTWSNHLCIYRTHQEIPVNFEPLFVQTDCVHYHNILMPGWFTLGIDLLNTHWGLDTPDMIAMVSRVIHWNRRRPVLFFRGHNSDDIPGWEDRVTKIFPREKLEEWSWQSPDLFDVRLVNGHPEYRVPLQKHCQYKYLIDTDGCCAANPRNMLLMFTGSVIFKTMSQSVSWYYSATKPYVHFIPVNNDLSDLMEKLEWAKNHDWECQMIAKNARMLARELFNKDMIDLYVYRLLEAYAAKQALYYHE